MLPGFMKVLRTMDDIEVPDNALSRIDTDTSSDLRFTNDDLEDANVHTVPYVVSRMKSHIAIQLLVIQVIIDMYKTNLQLLSAANITIIVDSVFHSLACSATELGNYIAKENTKGTFGLRDLQSPFGSLRERGL